MAEVSQVPRDVAVSRARLAIEGLHRIGVDALVGGSLARGGFGRGSDVDFLVTRCPRDLKYAIEGRIEETLGAIPFDVVYLDEVPRRKVAAFLDGAIDASRLR